MKPEQLKAWAAEFREASQGHFQANVWIPDPPPVRNCELETRQSEFLSKWGPPVPAGAGDATPLDFEVTCQAMLDIAPKAVSSIMGLYPPAFVSELKARKIFWLATVTTVAEARAAEQEGADAIIAQGMEAGGHRGAFQAEEADRQMVGLMALLPQVVDAVSVPVIATGGIGDGRGVAAAFILGASAVQIGTGFLRSPEAKTRPAHADRITRTEAHETIVTRAFSGRPGRSIVTAYLRATLHGPPPAPYPVQLGLTAAMRKAALEAGDPEKMPLWAGQAAKFASSEPAGVIVQQLWDDASRFLS